MVYKPSDREKDIMHMKQDISGSLNELQKATSFVLEIVYQLKADLSRLYVLETELEEEMM